MSSTSINTPITGSSRSLVHRKLDAVVLAVVALGGCSAINLNGKSLGSSTPSSSSAGAAVGTSNGASGATATDQPVASLKPGPCPNRAGMDNTIDRFAKLAAEDLKQTEPFCAGQLKGGVPTPLFPILLKYYHDRAENTESDINALRKVSAEFDPIWAAYMKRLTVVRKAVADAATLRKQGDQAKADAALRAVITTRSPIESDGGFYLHDEFLLPIDAESEAVAALIASARQRGDLHTLFEMMPLAAARRPVGDDAETQRVLYMASEKPALMRSLADWAPQAIGLIQREVEQRKQRQVGIARALYQELVDGKQLASAPTFGKPSGKKGNWVVLQLPSEEQKKTGPGITSDKIDFAYEGVAYHPYDCKETDKIDWISNTGDVHWRVDCKFHEEKKPGKIKATLAAAPPEGKQYGMWVIGQIAATSGGWQLDRARIYDLRYLGELERRKR